MTIALLLGSFNPPHLAHIALADYVLAQGLADAVWFVLSPQNPLKDRSQLAPYADRSKMVQLAIENRPHMRLETIENELPQPSYTYHTIVELTKKHPTYTFFILAGSDIYQQMNRWYKYEELAKMVRFLYYPRTQGHSYCSHEMQNAPMIDISSTQIRENEDNRAFLDPKVHAYINEHELYKMGKTITYYNELIAREPKAEHFFERGKLHYTSQNFGRAVNDFNSALAIDSHHAPSRQMLQMVHSILDFRHFDIYNP